MLVCIGSHATHFQDNVCRQTHLVKAALHLHHALMCQRPVGCAKLDHVRDDIVCVAAGVEAGEADHLGVQWVRLPSHHSLQAGQASTADDAAVLHGTCE